MRLRKVTGPLDAARPLINPKHEFVARELAKFKSIYDAAREAGYHEGKAFRSSARKLGEIPEIRARVEYLQRVSAVTDAVDSAFVQRKLLEFITPDLSPVDIKPSDRIKALEMLCKVNGLFAPTKVAPTNPEGTEPWSGTVTDEDRVKALEAFLAKVKLRGQ